MYEVLASISIPIRHLGSVAEAPAGAGPPATSARRPSELRQPVISSSSSTSQLTTACSNESAVFEDVRSWVRCRSRCRRRGRLHPPAPPELNLLEKRKANAISSRRATSATPTSKTISSSTTPASQRPHRRGKVEVVAADQASSRSRRRRRRRTSASSGRYPSTHSSLTSIPRRS